MSRLPSVCGSTAIPYGCGVGVRRSRGDEAAEAAGDADKVLLARIEALLDDALRPGAPGDFSAEQLVQIISVACESPGDLGRPVTHWTSRELADEVIKHSIVKSISPHTVGRFLEGGRSQAASLDLLAASSARCGPSRL